MDTKLENMNKEVCLKDQQEKCENSQWHFESTEIKPSCETTDSSMEIEIEEDLGNDDSHSSKIDSLHHIFDRGLQKVLHGVKQEKIENDDSCFENVPYTAVSNFHDFDNRQNIGEKNVQQGFGTEKERFGNLQSRFPKNDNIYIFENTNSQHQDKPICVEIINIKQETEDHNEHVSELENSKFEETDLAKKRSEFTIENNHARNTDVENSYAKTKYKFIRPAKESTSRENSGTMVTRPDVHPHSSVIAQALNRSSKHEVAQLHKCNMCGREYIRLSDLRRHMTTHDSEGNMSTSDGPHPPQPCLVCDKVFKSPFFLRRHMISHSTERPHKCNICGKGYKGIDTLRSHIKTHSTERPHQCNMCDKEFKSAYSLKSHMISHSTGMPHQCSVCGKAFKRQTSLNKHMTTHRPERPHHCNVCGKGFKMSVHLRNHMFCHRTERPHQCTLCDERFKAARDVRQHMKRHSTARPHQCDLCDKDFKGLPDLRQHMISHRTERPHQCTLCERGFKTPRNLKDHMVIHSPERSHQCNVCGKVFKRLYHLKSHMISHSTDRPHQCNLCDREFKRLQDLKEHMVNIHTTERPHQCNLCDRGYKTAKSLRNHMLCMHTDMSVLNEQVQEEENVTQD